MNALSQNTASQQREQRAIRTVFSLSLGFGAASIVGVTLLTPDKNEFVYTLHRQTDTTTYLTARSKTPLVTLDASKDILQQAFSKYGRNVEGEKIIIGNEGPFYDGTFDEKAYGNITLIRNTPNDGKGCALYSYHTHRPEIGTRAEAAVLATPSLKRIIGNITLCPLKVITTAPFAF